MLHFFTMNRAFTLTELILVIIIIALVAVTASTRFQKDTLIPATNQIADHIRYTQQLALNQDMYVPNPDFAYYNTTGDQKKSASQRWYKKWWQIQFHSKNGELVSYSVYSDHPTDSGNFWGIPQYSTNKKLSDIIAKDPQTGLFLFSSTYGCSTSGSVDCNERFELVDLKKEFGVHVKFRGCRSRRILFDEIGRPHCANPNTSPYDNLARKPITVCVIDRKTGESNVISVEPITGYLSIDFGANCP